MSWFDKLMPSRIRTEKRKHSVPEGLWVKCAGCSAQLYRAELNRNLHVCPKCGHHLRIGARERLEMFLDPESGYELAANLEPLDPLRFKDTKRYRERLNQAQRETDERDALVVMAGTLKSDAGRRGRLRVSFHLGLDGLGRRRAVRARRRVLHPASAPARLLLRERRRAHAGGAVLAAADGEDELGARAARGREAAVRLRDDRSDDGRRFGEPRAARRRQHRRARRADLLRGAARHRADDRRDAARRLPARRVPAREGRDRHDPRSPARARPDRGAAREARARGPCCPDARRLASCDALAARMRRSIVGSPGSRRCTRSRST